MGCFNVSCGISNLSIDGGDKVLLYALLPSRYNDGTKVYSSYLSITDLYVPLCFPIEGEYDEYGSINNIVKDANTEAVAEFLKMDIEEFVKYITGYNDTKKIMDLKVKNIINDISVMFVRKDIHDFLTERKESLLKNPNLISVKPYLLNKMGFVIKDNKNLYEKPNIYEKDNIEFKLKNSYEQEMYIKKEEAVYKIWTFKDFLNAYEKLSGSKMILDKTFELDEVEIAYGDFIFKEYKNLKNLEETYKILKDDLKLNFDFNATRNYTLLCTDIFQGFQKWDYLFDIYRNKLFAEELKNHIIKQVRFNKAICQINKMYRPTFSGPQCGDRKAEKEMVEKMLEIVNKKIKNDEGV